MKKLQRKYKKKELQKLKCEIGFHNNKISFWIYSNLIGFSLEYYFHDYENNRTNNFYNYNHCIEYENKKLKEKIINKGFK